MTCETCGERPKKDKRFPSAVVEINNPEQLVLWRKVVVPSSLGDDITVPPTIGKYRNVVLVYEANDHIYLYSSDGIPTKIDSTVPQEVLDRITELELDVDLLETSLAVETDARERADQGLQQEIDDLKNSPDVVDIVATYAELMAYDTSTLGDKDVIRVLRDETHEGQSDYYRWSTSTQAWTFIGTVGDYYTKQQVDTLLDTKQDELTPGENIVITDESGDLVISAVDTTYTAGYGLELEGTEFSVNPDIVQDALTAGDNISIEDESGSLVISAVDTTYSAGSGLNLADTTFSVDTTTIATQADLDAKQDTLTAGDNITIEDESGALVISAADTTYTAGSNVQISPQNVISATDTTYTHFTGATASTDGVQGLVPGPLAGDENKYLKGDGTWGTVQAGPTVVQTTGTSTTDVMSQNAVTSMIYADPSTEHRIQIAPNGSAGADYSVAIGRSASVSSAAQRGIAIGDSATASAVGSIALGMGSSASTQGEMNIGTYWTNAGYNSSSYRLLTGLYDPQSAHDAATKGYVDTSVGTKQDELTAGENITIQEESGALVISATGGGADVSTITMTTTDPGEGSALAANHYIGVYGGDPIVLDYSTSEVNTGAKWIDGSAIYKKTIHITNMPAASAETNTAHNITNLNVVVKIEGIGVDGSNRYSSIPQTYTPNMYSSGGLSMRVTNANVTLSANANGAGVSEGYVTLYYTKSS